MSLDLVTYVSVDSGYRGMGHDRLEIRSRGRTCGILFVDAGDGEALARRLLPGCISVDRDGSRAIYRPAIHAVPSADDTLQGSTLNHDGVWGGEADW